MDPISTGDTPEDPSEGANPEDATPQSEPGRSVVVLRETPPRGGNHVERVPHMARVRWSLARYLILLLGAVIVGIFVLIATAKWTDVPLGEVRSIFDIMFTALVALVGSAVGFYFGSEGKP